MAAWWLLPVPRVLVVGGIAIAVCACILALNQPGRLTALHQGASGGLLGRTGDGVEMPLEVLVHQIIGGRAVALCVRASGQRSRKSLLLLPGDQSEHELRALRAFLLHRPKTVDGGSLRSATTARP